MRGRKPKPAKLLLFENKTHIAKREIQERLAAEIKIGGAVFIAPDYIRADLIALAKWNELINLYKNAPIPDLVDSSDTDAIAQYCMTFAEQKYLIEQRAKAKQAKAKIKFTTALLKNREMLLKLSNHLYLNPLAKIRNVPKKKNNEPKSPLQKAGFGNVL
jgi:phage terminase small subunit